MSSKVSTNEPNENGESQSHKDFLRIISELKEKGRSQMETVRYLVVEQGLSLREADQMVLESHCWRKDRLATDTFREAFQNYLEDEK